MKARPLTTLSLLILSCGGTLLLPTLDTSIYGVNGSPLLQWSFTPELPLKQFGLPWITTPFLHKNLQHLFMNCIFLIPAGLMIERKYSAKELALAFGGIHFLTLACLTGGAILSLISGAYFFGMSHGISGLYAYLALREKKIIHLWVLAMILIAGWWTHQLPFTQLSHALGILGGLLLGGLRRFQLKRRP